MELAIVDQVKDILLDVDVHAGDLVHLNGFRDLQALQLAVRAELHVHRRPQNPVGNGAPVDFLFCHRGPMRAPHGREVEVPRIFSDKVDLV